MRSIAIPKLYSILHERVLPLVADQCDSRLTNLALLMLGLYRGRSVHLSRIASRIPSRARKVCTTERLRRFLSNPAVKVELWYAATAQTLLQRAAVNGWVHFIIDSSKIGFGQQLLMVSLAYGRRSLPIAWRWIPYKRGHSTTQQQLALLRVVKGLVPVGVQASLVGDCEFGRPLLLEELDHWGWQYALRQPGDHLIWPSSASDWLRLDWIHLLPNVPHWLTHTLLTAENAYPTSLVLYHQSGQREAWFLATNCACPRAAIRLYRRRMWIEEMFGDMKTNGFDVEATHLRDSQRLDRLMLALALLYVWFIALGEYLIRTGQTALVDRKDRRDLSLFRLGFDFLDRLLDLAEDPPTLFFPAFDLVLGG
jgi:hypothetical protein